MKSTEVTTQINALNSENDNQSRLLDLLRKKRIVLKQITRQWWRNKLKRINAEIELYKLDLEIEAKKKYLVEIQRNIDLVEGSV